MQITDVRVRKVTKEGKMRAVVSITIDDVFVVHDIKVIEGEKGLFIAMPGLYEYLHCQCKHLMKLQMRTILLQLQNHYLNLYHAENHSSL